MTDKPVSDTWERGDPYEQYVGRWSRRVAPMFLRWLHIPARRRWLDMGCGTGALCAAILDICSPRSVVGVEPSEGFLKTARANLGRRAVLHQGSATEIPLDDASVDVVVSALMLNFVSDPHAALGEMKRVSVPGGTIAAYVWDYGGEMEMMRVFWDEAVALNPAAVVLDEGIRFPICQPNQLIRLFETCGLDAVEAEGITIPTPFTSFDDYWRPFLGGQGPAPAYLMSLSEPARAQLGDSVRRRLERRARRLESLSARAWAVRGLVAK